MVRFHFVVFLTFTLSTYLLIVCFKVKKWDKYMLLLIRFNLKLLNSYLSLMELRTCDEIIWQRFVENEKREKTLNLIKKATIPKLNDLAFLSNAD